jgi:hypothetical protein
LKYRFQSLAIIDSSLCNACMCPKGSFISRGERDVIHPHNARAREEMTPFRFLES